MRTPLGGLRPVLLLLLATVIAGLAAAPASPRRPVAQTTLHRNAAKALAPVAGQVRVLVPGFPLRTGSHGRTVKELQRVLSGHRPSRYPGIHYLPRDFRPNGLFGRRTADALSRMKWRLGWVKAVPVLDVQSWLILTGKTPRPPSYVARAGARIKAVKAADRRSRCTARILAYARSQVGVVEQPFGSNRGPKISYPWPHGTSTPSYQSITGAYGAAWCVSFAQWVLYESGLGPIASRTAGVFYLVGWARLHDLSVSYAQPGLLVSFLNGQGHQGIVVRVGAGWFVSIEGNASNGVRERFHRLGDRPVVFERISGCSA